MLYFNSLLLLRLINIFLLCFILRELFGKFDLYDWTKCFDVTFRSSSVSNKTSELSWSDIDILSPPSLNNTILEAIRFHELLAKPSYKCKDRKNIGELSESFFVCFESELFDADINRSVLIVSGSSSDSGSLEKNLTSAKWTVFSLKESKFTQDILTGKVEGFYLPELVNDDDFPLVLNTKQLLLSIKFEEKPDAWKVVHSWYLLIYRMFYDYKYRTLGAESNGSCGRNLKHCLYRVSFVKVDIENVLEPPIFGMGSPIEERHRLINYLNILNKQTSCTPIAESKDEIPLSCLLKPQDSCLVVYFRNRLISQPEFISLTYPKCLIYLFYSQPTNISFPSSIKYISNGISSQLTEVQIVPGHSNEYWQLKPFDLLVQQIDTWQNINILSIDLDGSEWDVMATITSACQLLKRFNEIIFRFKVWKIEEGENYRRFYHQFLLLEDCGFEKQNVTSRNNSNFFLSFIQKLTKFA
uniref:Methyltransferase FkbM domain-containing protein n=1 Tax=Acrobeloides nanus TaxID=290746 RepID=A0A914D2R7_9BILA